MASTETPAPVQKIRVRLHSIAYAATDALLFEFRALDGAALPPAAPGAHIDVHLPNGLNRPYSLVASSPYAIAVKREAGGRGGSAWLHDHARVGMDLEISAPRNAFPLDESAAATLLLAGGIGITPISAMYRRLNALDRNVELHYWSRSSEHALFRSEFEGAPGVTLHYGDAPSRGNLAAIVASAPPETELYCCGPDRMLTEFAAATADRAPERLHTERFSATELAPPTEGFTVTLARTGIELAVEPGRTILETLIEAGIDIAYSCEQGICGACETKVIDGSPLHRDSFRKPEEHDRLSTVMVCCAGSSSAWLVLEL